MKDIPAITAIYAHYVLTSAGTFELEPPDEAEMARRLAAAQEGAFPFLAAEMDRRIVGYAYASAFRPRAAYRFTVEDSVYVDAGFVGKGVGRELLRELIAACRAAQFRQIIAVMGGENPASIGLHASHGFVLVGVLREVGFKFDGWRDVTLMQLTL